MDEMKRTVPRRRRVRITNTISIDDILQKAGAMSVSIDKLIRGFQYGPKGKNGPNSMDIGNAVHEMLDNKFKYDELVTRYNLQQTRKKRR